MGFPREWKRHPRVQTALQQAPVPAPVRAASATVRATARPQVETEPELNRTEREYLDMLEACRAAGEIDTIYGHESMRLRIGHACFYSPDFPIVRHDGTIEMHEVKGGRIEEDAMVKFKAAARLYPHFRWVMAQKKGGVWTILHQL